MVLLGRLGRAHGVRGEIRLDFFGEDPGLLTGIPLTLRDPRSPKADGAPPVPGGEREAKVIGIRPSAKGPILTLEGVSDREEARALQGLELLARRDALPEIADDEIYQHDLIGMRAKGPSDEELGVVRGIVEGPEGTLILSIAGPDGSETLIPFTSRFILDLDQGTGTITTLSPGELAAMGFVTSGR
jgi:16S rRNA processing protein RimM